MSRAVLEALTGRSPLCMDRNGWFELTTDGERMWVEEYGKQGMYLQPFDLG